MTSLIPSLHGPRNIISPQAVEQQLPRANVFYIPEKVSRCDIGGPGEACTQTPLQAVYYHQTLHRRITPPLYGFCLTNAHVPYACICTYIPVVHPMLAKGCPFGVVDDNLRVVLEWTCMQQVTKATARSQKFNKGVGSLSSTFQSTVAPA